MINQVGASATLLYEADTSKKTAAKAAEKKSGDIDSAFSLDLSATSAKKGSRALSSKEIDSIMEQTDATTSALKDVVEKLIVQQKSTNSTFTVNVEILTASANGLADISQDADWGVEAVSDRIVDFAKALSGGDTSKLEMLREAIDKGFAGAKKTLGGKLPSVSMDTYDAVMSKLDAWAGESNPEPTEV